MILAKWLEPTRLETRTKESNIYASMWSNEKSFILDKPTCETKVNNLTCEAIKIMVRTEKG